jgi:hypothetical protein
MKAVEIPTDCRTEWTSMSCNTPSKAIAFVVVFRSRTATIPLALFFPTTRNASSWNCWRVMTFR